MVAVLPDAEALLARFLREDVDVAALVGDNVFTALPAGFDAWPAVRLTRVSGGPPWQHPLVLDQPQLQIDVFGGTKEQARLIVDTIRAVADERLPAVHSEGIVYRVNQGVVSYIPDQTFDPARPRYLFDLTLTTRAAP